MSRDLGAWLGVEHTLTESCSRPHAAVVGGLEVALLPYGEWRRLTPPSRRKIIDPITVDYEGVKDAARGVDLRVQLSYDKVGDGKIGTTTMQVTMGAPAI